MKDLHSLPKVRDSWSYLYVERCRIDQEAKAIAIHDQRGTVAVPCAAINLLMLGPGTTVTHAAMRMLAENGCMVEWTGEGGVRTYAHSTGETRSSRNLLRQAALASDPGSRLQVIDRMYRMRFSEEIPAGLSLQQLRGREGLRVRKAYADASAATGVAWQGRFYRRDDWRRADPINRALSVANSTLYGVCHARQTRTNFQRTPLSGYRVGSGMAMVLRLSEEPTMAKMGRRATRARIRGRSLDGLDAGARPSKPAWGAIALDDRTARWRVYRDGVGDGAREAVGAILPGRERRLGLDDLLHEQRAGL